MAAIPADSSQHQTPPTDVAPALSRWPTRLGDSTHAVTPTNASGRTAATTETVLLVTADRRLAPALAPIAAENGFDLRLLFPNTQADAAGWRSMLAPAVLVVADLATPGGMAVAQAASEQHYPIVTIAPMGGAVPDEHGQRTLFYGKRLDTFLQLLADRIAAVAVRGRSSNEGRLPGADDDQTVAEPSIPLLEEPTVPKAEKMHPEDAPGSRQPAATVTEARGQPDSPPKGEASGLPLLPLVSAPTSELRLAIYRTVALDPEARLEQRFHAARVLATYGDYEVAAIALGAVASAASPLREEALALLGTFGPLARVALWALDATEQDPLRNVAIARQMHAAGETSAARLRLERLACHADREVRTAALHALLDLGVVAYGEFMRLLQQAPDPHMRLEAARWLRLHQLALPEVVAVLTALADQPDSPSLARNALQELSAVRTAEAGEALTDLARHAALGSIRLAAAHAIGKRGDAEVAHGVLFRLAEGPDEETAVNATEALLTLSQDPATDAGRLMRRAALVTIRCRAAAHLAHAHQSEEVQQQAAHVLLALDQPEHALPCLARLALGAGDVSRRQWAAEQLINLGAPALGLLLDVLEARTVPTLALRLAETVLAMAPEAGLQHRAARSLAEHGHSARAAAALTEIALSEAVREREAQAVLTDLGRLALATPEAVQGLSQVAAEAPIISVRRRALEYLRRRAGADVDAPRDE